MDLWEGPDLYCTTACSGLLRSHLIVNDYDNDPDNPDRRWRAALCKIFSPNFPRLSAVAHHVISCLLENLLDASSSRIAELADMKRSQLFTMNNLFLCNDRNQFLEAIKDLDTNNLCNN